MIASDEQLEELSTTFAGIVDALIHAKVSGGNYKGVIENIRRFTFQLLKQIDGLVKTWADYVKEK